MSSESPIFILNKTIIDAVSMAANITQNVVDISEVSAIAVTEIYVGSSPTGDIVIELSPDGTNWFTKNTKSITTDGVNVVEFETALKWLSVKYTRTSGTGALTVIVSGKK